jgi:alkylation response protein AidB-like acyl-CoA dehydrogenase
MDLMPSYSVTPEREQLRESVSQFLADKSPMGAVRALMETPDGYDPAVWAQLAGQLGLAGLAIPQEYGGSGYSWAELVIVLEEMGAALLCAPYFASVALAASAVLAAGDEAARRELLPGIASGEVIATLAVAEDSGRWDAGSIRLTATAAGGQHTVSGHKTFVIDGQTAQLIIVAARTGDDLALLAVAGDAPGLTRTPLPTMDMTRRQARLEFSATPARLLSRGDEAGRALATTLDLAAVALAAEQAGGARRCLDLSVAYAKSRTQFGRPIGSFQAIKHKCADMLLQVESARSAARYAGWAAAYLPAELPAAASLAKAFCSDAYARAAGATIQIHGGIGFTWEHDAHLHFKRATTSALLFGDPAYHRELLAQRIGI